MPALTTIMPLAKDTTNNALHHVSRPQKVCCKAYLATIPRILREATKPMHLQPSDDAHKYTGKPDLTNQ